MRPRRSGASSAPAAPQPAQASISHGVKSPCPRKKFETNAAVMPTPIPARRPSVTPAEHGDVRHRLHVRAPARAAHGPRPPRRRASRSRRSPSRSPARRRASVAAPSRAPRPRAAARAPTRASRTRRRRTPRARRGRRYAASATSRSATARANTRSCVTTSVARARACARRSSASSGLALRVDAARRLVEHEQVGLGDEHGREREPLALAAREVARMPRLVAGEPDVGERAPRARARSRAERDLLVAALADEVAARILEEDTRAAAPLDASALRRKQAGGELRERRLAASRSGRSARRPRRDAARATRSVEHRPVVGERDLVDAATTSPPVQAASRAGLRRARPGDVLEPGDRLVARRVEQDPARAPGRRRGPRSGSTARRALLGDDDAHGRRRARARGRRRRRRDRAARSARRAAAARGSSASADARQTRWSSPPESPVDAAVGEVRRCRPRRAPRCDARARSPRARCRCSRARTRPRRRRAPSTIWSSGSWKTLATVPASSAGRVRRVSRPATSTRPSKRPPWNHGTRPANARSSVDLPEPDGPSRSTTSPGSTASETSRSAGAVLRIGEGEPATRR